MYPTAKTDVQCCKPQVDREAGLAISKGLPPPPNASGLLLLVCAGLLLKTVTLPPLTAVRMNALVVLWTVTLAPLTAVCMIALVVGVVLDDDGAGVVLEEDGVAVDVDVEVELELEVDVELDVELAVELGVAVTCVMKVEWRTTVVVSALEDEGTDVEASSAVVVTVLVTVEDATAVGKVKEVGLESDDDTLDDDTLDDDTLDDDTLDDDTLDDDTLDAVSVLPLVTCVVPAFGHSIPVAVPAMN